MDVRGRRRMLVAATPSMTISIGHPDEKTIETTLKELLRTAKTGKTPTLSLHTARVAAGTLLSGVASEDAQPR